MNQMQIGAFLRELRKEKNVTQEQLAELFGVSNRTVSRWETGKNLPDLSLLLSLAAFYEVSTEELLQGARVSDRGAPTEATVQQVAEYSEQERAAFSRRLHRLFLAGIGGFLLFILVEYFQQGDNPWIGYVSEMGLGMAFGMLIVGAIFTGRRAARIRAAKLELLRRLRAR